MICKYEVVLGFSKVLNLKLNMLFFVDRLLHYCEFKDEHAFSNQLFSRPLFDPHHILPGAFQFVMTLLVLFKLQSLLVNVIIQLLKKKLILKKCPYIFSSKVS